MAATSATSLVNKMHYCKIMERECVSPMNSAFSLAMAATSATSLVDKMHYCGFLTSTAGTSATSLVDKMHFCKIMEKSVLRYRIDVLFDDGCNKHDIFS
jgi:hypothetical protein